MVSGGKVGGSGTGSGSKTNQKGNLRGTPCLRKLRKAYYGFHVCSLIIGGIAIFLGIWVSLVEKESLKDLKLAESTSKSLSIGYYVAGGCIILAGTLGAVALIKDNVPYLWIVYTMLMAVVSLVLFTVSVSFLTHKVGGVEKKLKELMETYVDIESIKEGMDKEPINNVDDFQEHNQCCGIESYKDWQDVPFGKTSLRVPRSCCNVNSTSGKRLTRDNSKNLIGNDTELEEEYKYCGHLCLPDSDYLDVIFTRGCREPLTSNLKMIIIGMGLFGLFISILSVGIFILSCYLVIWKKV